MHEFVYFNRRFLTVENAFLSVANAAALYGKSVFTTVAVYNFQPFLWEKHLERLRKSAGKIGIDLSEIKASVLKNALAELIEKNNFRDGRARLTFYDDSATVVWQNRSIKKTSLHIQTADFRLLKEPLKLTVSPFSLSRIASSKFFAFAASHTSIFSR